jgi:two-component system, cell cycle sensor histidine kinase and response regulator CckA
MTESELTQIQSELESAEAQVPLKDKEGALVGLVEMFQDNTEKKQNYEVLAQERLLLHTLMDNLPDNMYFKDTACRFIRINKALTSYFGLDDPAQAIGKTDFDFFQEANARESYDDEQIILQSGLPMVGKEEQEIWIGGRIRWVSTTKMPMRDKDGKIIGTFGVSRDITQAKQAEASLREREELLRAVIANIPCGVFWKDRKCVYLGCNDQVARDHEADSPEKVVGGTDYDLGVLPAEAEFYRECDRQVMETGEPILNLEESQTRRNGAKAVLLTSKVPLRDTAGRVFGVLGVYQDITDRKILEEQLRQAQKMEAIGQLAGGVAHDFNNLLTVINGYSEILLADLTATDQRRELVASIRDAGERASRLTSQLLSFGRKAIVKPKVLDLNEVIDSTGKLLRRLIGEDVTLTTILNPGLSRVKIDPGQFEQVIINVAVNARDAMPKGGRLTIETKDIELPEGFLPDGSDKKSCRYIRLSISDTGAGMTDEVKAHIFEPFFTTKEVGKGTGLGLATVYGIVKQADGHITVESQIDIGTTITILLPAVVADAAIPHKSKIKVVPRGTETILLVEDEDEVRKLARMSLEIQGYTVLEAGTGKDALSILEAHSGQIQLLVTDVVMPDLGGRKLADAVRARSIGVKVLYMSGHTDDALIRHGVSEELDVFLQKPFTPLVLAQKVREVLDTSIESTSVRRE